MSRRWAIIHEMVKHVKNSPHEYHLTMFPSWGTNSSFFLERLLKSFNLGPVSCGPIQSCCFLAIAKRTNFSDLCWRRELKRTLWVKRRQKWSETGLCKQKQKSLQKFSVENSWPRRLFWKKHNKMSRDDTVAKLEVYLGKWSIAGRCWPKVLTSNQ